MDIPKYEHPEDDPAHFALVQAAEIEAENAWLRAAEAPDADALAFYAWEEEMGLR